MTRSAYPRERTPLVFAQMVAIATTVFAGLVSAVTMELSVRWGPAAVAIGLLAVASAVTVIPRPASREDVTILAVVFADIVAITVLSVAVPGTEVALVVPVAWLALSFRGAIPWLAFLGGSGLYLLAHLIAPTTADPWMTWGLLMAGLLAIVIVGGRFADDHVQRERDRAQRIATATHELRSPLTAVLGYVALAREHPSLDEGVRGDLDVALRNIELLRDRINDLDPDSALSLAVEDCDLTTLVADSVAAVRPRAAARGVRIDLEAEELTVRADPSRVRQVVDILLFHAEKYVHAGGQVAVTVTRGPDGEGAVIRVDDHGPGAGDDGPAHAVGRRLRGGTVRASGIEGSGFVRDIVELHGGTFALTGAPGSGTSVRVTLPGS